MTFHSDTMKRNYIWPGLGIGEQSCGHVEWRDFLRRLLTGSLIRTLWLLRRALVGNIVNICIDKTRCDNDNQVACFNDVNLRRQVSIQIHLHHILIHIVAKFSLKLHSIWGWNERLISHRWRPYETCRHDIKSNRRYLSILPIPSGFSSYWWWCESTDMRCALLFSSLQFPTLTFCTFHTILAAERLHRIAGKTITTAASRRPARCRVYRQEHNSWMNNFVHMWRWIN